MPSVAIVGAGISGLATGFLLTTLRPDVDVTIFEREASPGGKVRSTRRGGFTFDWGPNGLLTNASATLELVEALGLSGELLPAAEVAQRRYLYHDGGLRPLPDSPADFLRSELISPTGKLRALLEPLLATRVNREESVFGFLQRHFGSGVASTFAGPLVVGTTAGDARKLSLDALVPSFRNLERERRSLLLEGLARQLRRRPGEGHRSRPNSFRAGGVQRLTDALAARLGASLRCGVGVAALERIGEAGLRILLDGGEAVEVERVVLATPAFTSAELLEPHLPEASELLAAIPYVDVQVFGFGFDRVDVPRRLDGSGFVVPRGEGVRCLEVLWSSAVFPDQAPEGKVMLRVIAGGTVDPDFASLSPEEALAALRRDLEITMGITVEPDYCEAIRWRRGIPQYLLGHRARLERIEAALTALPGVTLVGDGYRGVGIDACVRDAKRVATALAG